MAGRLTTILTRFKGCYAITRNIWHSLRFAAMKPRNGKTLVKVNGRKVWLRNNKTDQQVFFDTFLHQYHRPPVRLEQHPTIVDLGSNIGLTIIDLKLQYPDARIIGAEPDRDNYETCLQNIAGLKDCEVVQAAIWKSDGVVRYGGTDEQSYSVNDESVTTKGISPSMTMDSFIEQNKIGQIDYLKMDIEGAEYAILLDCKNKNWLQKLKYLSIEVHDTPALNKETGMEKLVSELENNHFQVTRSATHWSSLFAINKNSLKA